jgi:hypothetical protein
VTVHLIYIYIKDKGSSSIYGFWIPLWYLQPLLTIFYSCEKWGLGKIQIKDNKHFVSAYCMSNRSSSIRDSNIIKVPDTGKLGRRELRSRNSRFGCSSIFTFLCRILSTTVCILGHFFFCPLSCLPFFYLRLLVTPLVYWYIQSFLTTQKPV